MPCALGPSVPAILKKINQKNATNRPKLAFLGLTRMCAPARFARGHGRTACLRRPSSKGPKGGAKSNFKKNKQKGKGVARSAACRPLVCSGRGGPCPEPWPALRPTSPNLDTRYDHALCRQNRTHGAHGLLVRLSIGSTWGFGRSPACVQVQKSENKEKGAAGSKFRPAPAAASAQVTPFCSLGNESIEGEWPAAALRMGYRPVVLTRRGRYWRQTSLAKTGLRRHSADGVKAAPGWGLWAGSGWPRVWGY
jgi:hypothetical protein